MDSFLIVEEVVHSLQTNMVDGFILKLDFEKAFDSVDWNFLFKVLQSFGFGDKWTNWIKSILESSRMSVLVNGSPTSEFGMSRGLRQGDPLSPMLFNLIGEVLHLILEKACDLGFFKGIQLGNGPIISHVQYADDIVLIFERSLKSCRGVKLVMLLFQLLFGLKINFGKSVLYAKDPHSDLVSSCASILGCSSGTWPFSYVGLQVGSSPRRKSFWFPVVKKVKTKLSHWKCFSLNKAGRTTLIKAVLNNLPVYYWSFF